MKTGDAGCSVWGGENDDKLGVRGWVVGCQRRGCGRNLRGARAHARTNLTGVSVKKLALDARARGLEVRFFVSDGEVGWR